MYRAEAGYINRLRNAAHSVVPNWSALRLKVGGRPIYIDPYLRGEYRFSRGLGEQSMYGWMPDTEMLLTADSKASELTLTVNRTLPWLKAGCIVKAGVSAYHEVASVSGLAVTLTSPLDSALGVGVPVTLEAVPLNVSSLALAANQLNLPSEYPIVVGDKILFQRDDIAGAFVSYEVLAVSEAADEYTLTFGSDLPEDRTDVGVRWWLYSAPLYRHTIGLPGLRLGPLHFDIASGTLNDATRVKAERIQVELLDTNQIPVQTLESAERNDLLSGYAVLAEHFCFGRKLHGVIQYDRALGLRMVSGEDGLCGVVYDLPAAWSNAAGWTATVNAEHPGRLRIRIGGEGWQQWDFAAAGQHPVHIVYNGTPATRIVVIWVGLDPAGTHDNSAFLSDWEPDGEVPRWLRYSHRVELKGTAWLSTGAILKPAMLSLNDLRSDTQRLNAGVLL